MDLLELKKYAENIGAKLPTLAGRKVLIVGDVGVDEYIWGEVKRISPEAPVPVVDVTKEDSALGLSSNVAANVGTLGGEAILVSVVGDDAGAKSIAKLLGEVGVTSDHLITDNERPTTRKVRILGEHQQVVRVDFEKKMFLSEATEQKLVSKVKELIPAMDIVILQDYAKGVLSENVCQQVIQLARKSGKKVLVDPHRNTPLHFYKGATLFKPNHDESIILSGFEFNSLNPPKNLDELVAKSLKDQLECEEVVITLGKQGVLISQGDEFLRLPTVAKEVFDVTGAGDTAIASMALGLASGWSLDESCAFANFAAGVVVGKVGCKPCYKDELLSSLQHQ